MNIILILALAGLMINSFLDLLEVIQLMEAFSATIIRTFTQEIIFFIFWLVLFVLSIVFTVQRKTSEKKDGQDKKEDSEKKEEKINKPIVQKPVQTPVNKPKKKLTPEELERQRQAQIDQEKRAAWIEQLKKANEKKNNQ